MTAAQWLDLIKTFGLPLVMFAFAIFTGYRRMWVWGSFLNDCEARASELQRRSDKWEHMALRGTELAESGTSIAAELTEIAKRVGGT